MNEKVFKLIKILACNELISGQVVADELRLSRAAVWKLINSAKVLGLDIRSFPSRGYLMSDLIDFLSLEFIQEQLSPEYCQQIKQFDVFNSIDSTNGFLLKQIFDTKSIPAVCVAEYQSKGRGRRGNGWSSPYAKNIYFSCLWRFNVGLSALPHLSLAIGLQLARWLRTKVNEPQALTLKWPNDIYYQDKKLAGILLEVRGEMNDHCTVVFGLGLNVHTEKSASNRQWAALDKAGGQFFDRNQLVAELINQLFSLFNSDHLLDRQYCLKDWAGFDYLLGKTIQMESEAGVLRGKCAGVDMIGNLIVLDDKGKQRICSAGEVRLVREVAAEQC